MTPHNAKERPIASVSELQGKALQAETLAMRAHTAGRSADARAYRTTAGEFRAQAELLRSMRRAQTIPHEVNADESYAKALGYDKTLLLP